MFRIAVGFPTSPLYVCSPSNSLSLMWPPVIKPHFSHSTAGHYARYMQESAFHCVSAPLPLSHSLSPFLSPARRRRRAVRQIAFNKPTIVHTAMGALSPCCVSWHGLRMPKSRHVSLVRAQNDRAGLDHFLLQCAAQIWKSSATRAPAKRPHFCSFSCLRARPNSSLDARDCSANDALETVVRVPKSSRYGL